MSTVQITPGFSVTNRSLLYISFMLAPAQFISGLRSNCPSNLGFLAYNVYTQIAWYQDVKAKQLHALSLALVHFNLIYAISYLGGVTSGNIVMALLLGFGTAGVIVLNTVAAWTSWATNQLEGFGVYQFFFFGWRTFSPGWHKFILVWQIFDSIVAFSCLFAAIGIATAVVNLDEKPPWYLKYSAIPIGAVAMLLGGWPLILWTELLVARNHIESATDMIAVWLFVAQVGAMLIPSCSACFGRFKGIFRNIGETVEQDVIALGPEENA